MKWVFDKVTPAGAISISRGPRGLREILDLLYYNESVRDGVAWYISSDSLAVFFECDGTIVRWEFIPAPEERFSFRESSVNFGGYEILEAGAVIGTAYARDNAIRIVEALKKADNE